MSIRSDAQDDYVVRTANLPATLNPFTVCFWARMQSDVGDQALWGLWSDSVGTYDYNIELWGYETGRTINLTTIKGGTWTVTSLVEMTLDKWYWFAVVISDTTHLTAYQAAVDTNAISSVSQTVGAGAWFTPTGLSWLTGRWLTQFYFNGSVFNAKVWTAALSAEELANERWRMRPSRTANLFAWYTMLPGSTERLLDKGGNGYNLTEHGTLSDEDHPPIGYGSRPYYINQAAAGGSTYNLSVDGGFTPAGGLLKFTSKILAGGFTPSGALSKQNSKILSGGFTPSGILIKQNNKILSGGLTPSGGLLKQTNKILTGGLTPAGALSKQDSKILSGGFTPTGALIKQTNKILDGGLTPSGALSAMAVFNIILSGTLSFAGGLLLQTGKIIGGGVTPSGDLSKLTDKTFGGALVPTGGLGGWTISKTISGVLTSSGTLLKETSKTFAGGLTPSGTLNNLISKTFDGTLPFAGSLIKLVGKILGGVLIPSGGLVNSSTSINVNAPFETMDCPDSWDDQLVQYFINFNLGTLIPPAVTNKRRNWLD